MNTGRAFPCSFHSEHQTFHHELSQLSSNSPKILSHSILETLSLRQWLSRSLQWLHATDAAAPQTAVFTPFRLFVMLSVFPPAQAECPGRLPQRVGVGLGSVWLQTSPRMVGLFFVGRAHSTRYGTCSAGLLLQRWRSGCGFLVRDGGPAVRL